ncbi:MAG: peptide-methionine (S)-S-oxide reductase [Acidobacteria bacterium]|nr:MAG: peptide-methionine (S)-S-oxide reductase [Acidobacteriota bacterium]
MNKGLAVFLLLATACAPAFAARAVVIPAPAVDEAPATKSDQKMIVFAGGCFWGIQAVFQHTKGVVMATSGYAGGPQDMATYEMVSTGRTGHAESVQVIYDPSKVTVGQLMRVFFSVAHDPTEVNRQGPDDGPQYRSEIFVANPEQETIAKAYIAQLDGASVYSAPIATKVSALEGFYPAEEYHQNYATKHPNDPYIVINDAPKVAALKKTLPQLYK